jgi:predicted RNase H-like nuclease (RuvC/YqgF family)
MLEQEFSQLEQLIRQLVASNSTLTAQLASQQQQAAIAQQALQQELADAKQTIENLELQLLETEDQQQQLQQRIAAVLQLFPARPVAE